MATNSKVVGVFPSKSRPEVKHTVVFNGATYWCSCEGWTFHRRCWHMNEVLAKVEAAKLKRSRGSHRKPKTKN